MEKATLELQQGTGDLRLHPLDGETTKIEVPPGDGYQHELAHFVSCIATKKKSTVAPPESALASVKLIEAELKSAQTGKKVAVKF